MLFRTKTPIKNFMFSDWLFCPHGHRGQGRL